jgi:hypothetical protein
MSTLHVILAFWILSAVGVLVFTKNRPRALAILLGIAAAMVTFGQFMAKGETPDATEAATQTAPHKESLDDTKPVPHPNWKLKTDEWERRGRPFERPIAPAQPYRVSCRVYHNEGCGVPGETCGAVAELAKAAFPEECRKLRADYETKIRR